MATANPLEDFLSTDFDENAVSDLVGTLESQLCSPTHKELPHHISESSISANHLNDSGVHNTVSGPVSLSFNSLPSGNQGIEVHKGLHVVVPQVVTSKSTASESQILGIDSVLNSTNACNLNSNTILNLNSHSHHRQHSNSPSPVTVTIPPIVNRTNTPPQTIHNSSLQQLRTTNTQNLNRNNVNIISHSGSVQQSVGIINVANGARSGHNSNAIYDLAAVAAEQKPLSIPHNYGGQSKLISVREPYDINKDRGVLGTATPPPHSNSPKPQSVNFNKNEVQVIGMSDGKKFILPQGSNIQIVNVSKGSHVNVNNPNVITVSRAHQPGVAVVRSQYITTQATQGHPNGGAPLTLVNVTSAHSIAHPTGSIISVPRPTSRVLTGTPIRIAAAPQAQQINIAPRLGANTITLPPGLQLPPGTLMKNDRGQLILVSSQPTGSLSTQPAPQTVLSNKLIHPIKGQTSQSPSRPGTPQSIVTIQPPHGQTTNVIHSQSSTMPSCVSVARSPGQMSLSGSIMTSLPQALPAQGVVPNVPVVHPPPVTTSHRPTSAGVTATLPGNRPPRSGPGLNVMEHVQKCRNFLSSLIHRASGETLTNVKALIQNLLDGKLEPEEFTEKLQVELESPPQPNLVPFFKKSLPLLRQGLYANKLTIDGIHPPPPEVLQRPPSGHSRSKPPVTATQMLNVRPGQQLIRPFQPLSHIPGSTVRSPLTTMAGSSKLTRPVTTNMATMHQGAMPSTMTMVNSRVHSATGKHVDAKRSASAATAAAAHKEKRKFESLKEDDDINDVATMGGVNLTEESKNILATNADFIGTQIRSCKDELFLYHDPLQQRICKIARHLGLEQVSPDVLSVISHATQERMRNIVERLSTIAEHRSEIYKVDKRYEVTHDTKSQMKFLEELDKLEKRRHEEQEREMLLRAAKSRTKTEDPEQAKLKQKAKELQQAEMEELRQREANLTALAAIGPRKKKKLELPDSGDSGGSSAIFNGPGQSRGSVNRPRIKRVNLRDLMFLLEQDRETSKSMTLFKSFLK